MKSIKRIDVQRKGGRKRETPKRGKIQTEMRDTQTGKGREEREGRKNTDRNVRHTDWEMERTGKAVLISEYLETNGLAIELRHTLWTRRKSND